MSVIFYCFQKPYQARFELFLPEGYRFELWRPSLSMVIPPGQGVFPFAAWWLMHQLRVFRGMDYSVALIMKDKVVVHRSLITPGYFRFPFMAKDDLQIGYLWTSPEHRGRRLASFALQEVVRSFGEYGRRFWYIFEKSNIASRKVAENAGFVRYGEGVREGRGVGRILGSFKIRHLYEE